MFTRAHNTSALTPDFSQYENRRAVNNTWENKITGITYLAKVTISYKLKVMCYFTSYLKSNLISRVAP